MTKSAPFASFASFAGQKYLNLETFRKTGAGVRTPVWFAAGAAASVVDPPLYVYSTSDSGKAKRVRNNGTVRIAPCDARGNTTGPWIEARATIVTGTEANLGMRLIGRKYRPVKQVLDAFALLFRRRERVVLAIRPV